MPKGAASYSTKATTDASLDTVGAKLARDGIHAVAQKDRTACIAAKAGSYHAQRRSRLQSRCRRRGFKTVLPRSCTAGNDYCPLTRYTLINTSCSLTPSMVPVKM